MKMHEEKQLQQQLDSSVNPQVKEALKKAAPRTKRLFAVHFVLLLQPIEIGNTV